MSEEKPPLPVPTEIEARAIPCDEEYAHHLFYPTAEKGYVRCSQCGLKARSEP